MEANNNFCPSNGSIYFIGQSEILAIGYDGNAWAGIINPENSGINIFVNTIAITNYSDIPFTSQLWVNSLKYKGKSSTKITPSNLSLIPPPTPFGKIFYEQFTKLVPEDGVNVFNRIVAPNSTELSKENETIVIPPGQNLLVFIVSPGNKILTSQVSFKWREEKI